MTYFEQWRAIAGRIRGLADAGELHASMLSVRASDSYGMAKKLREHGEAIFGAIQLFRDRFQDSLPAAANSAISKFIRDNEALFRDASSGPLLEERSWAALVLLRAFESELSFIFSDAQEVIRSRAELAFAHLQRMIVADPEVRLKWIAAFEATAGEVRCEKLGAVQLLLHGIWAFKVDATGERTDLVFQEPIGDVGGIARYASGLVLTEWKKVPDGAEPVEYFRQAHGQARRYASGALGGSELTGCRYLIVVTRRHVQTLADIVEGGVIYRHLNIAVDPESPSRAG